MLRRLAGIALATCCALACRQREADPAGDASMVDAGSDAAPATSGAGGAGLKPLALGCSAAAECASGFCVDGVCCDSACDGQCSVCNVSGNVGYCTAQLFGDDTTSTETCTGDVRDRASHRRSRRGQAPWHERRGCPRGSVPRHAPVASHRPPSPVQIQRTGPESPNPHDQFSMMKAGPLRPRTRLDSTVR